MDLGSSLALVSCQESSAGSRVFMMDAHTGAPLWESIAMAANFPDCIDVLAPVPTPRPPFSRYSILLLGPRTPFSYTEMWTSFKCCPHVYGNLTWAPLET